MLRTISIVLTLATLTLAGGLPGTATPVAGREPGLLAVAPPDNPLAIIVNKSNSVEDLTFAELRKVFLVEKSHWPNGRKITVVMREPGQNERAAVLRLIYRMNEGGFHRYFLQAVFSGEVQGGPKELSTAAGVRKFVAYVPGAIGYVRLDEVDESVKVIRVDGRAPTESDYKIKLAGR
jgi:phosphate transport system substrate-binding protein